MSGVDPIGGDRGHVHFYVACAGWEFPGGDWMPGGWILDGGVLEIYAWLHWAHT